MKRRRRSNALAFALFANAAALCAIVVLLASRSSPPMAFAQMQPSIAGGAGVFVMPAQFSRDVYGCYLLDVDAQTLCVYQFYPLEKQLRLAAARTFRFDRKLADFNTALPSPDEVKELLEKQARGVRGIDPTAETTQPTGITPIPPAQ
jgi:hypothetical protein